MTGAKTTGRRFSFNGRLPAEPETPHTTIAQKQFVQNEV
jgi:hypothetical protein